MFAIAGKKYYFRLDSLVSLPRKLQYVTNKSRNQRKKKREKNKEKRATKDTIENTCLPMSLKERF